MARAYSATFRKRLNAVSAPESPLLLLEINHVTLTEPARVVNDNDDFPYGESKAFKATTAYLLNDIVIPTEYNARYFKVTVAGTSGASEPVWPTTLTNTVTSGGVTFRCEGVQYKAMAFSATLPDDKTKQMPRAKLSIDNVTRYLADFVEASNGAEGTTVRMMQVLRSAPTVIEWEVTMNLVNILMKLSSVSGDLGFEDIANRPAVMLSYRPDVAPGLF